MASLSPTPSFAATHFASVLLEIFSRCFCDMQGPHTDAHNLPYATLAQTGSSPEPVNLVVLRSTCDMPRTPSRLAAGSGDTPPVR